MSDLQIGLISAGVLIILLVLVFNWWQDQRVRRQMQSKLPEAESDPLMGQLGGTAPVRKEPTVRIADSLKSSQDDAQVDEVDPTCEAVIDISFNQPVLGDELSQVLQTCLRNLSKPIRFFAITEEGNHHMRLVENERYVSMQLAILLANRSGPLSDIEWSNLWSAAQNVAQHFDAGLEGPEQHLVVNQAQQLDALCANLDAVVSLVVRLEGPVNVQRVLNTLGEAGFLSYGRQMAWLADSGIPRFTVLFDGQAVEDVQSASVERLDLVLDVPNSPMDTQAFSRMASVGRDLAVRLGGQLLDEQGRVFSEQSDQQIDEQLYTMYQQLEEAGFVAGESRTARVFA